MLRSFWRRASKVKQFNDGQKIDMAYHNRNPFENNLTKLKKMYMLRMYFINNSPYQFYNYKYKNQLTKIHNELNFQQSRILLRNLLLVTSVIMIYTTFVMEEFAVDWRDKFDLKFNTKAYGGLDDSSGEGNASIDD